MYLLILYGVYLFLAVFNAGNMMTLQIQHFGIYPTVGKENFKNYMKANNKSAIIPSILPAVLLILTNIILVFVRPDFMPKSIAILSLVLNIIAFISTATWQRKLQEELAFNGYDEIKIFLLISTNWIRTLAFLIEAIIAVAVIMNAVNN
jgi:hypothetical protein